MLSSYVTLNVEHEIYCRLSKSEGHRFQIFTNVVVKFYDLFLSAGRLKETLLLFKKNIVYKGSESFNF